MPQLPTAEEIGRTAPAQTNAVVRLDTGQAGSGFSGAGDALMQLAEHRAAQDTQLAETELAIELEDIRARYNEDRGWEDMDKRFKDEANEVLERHSAKVPKGALNEWSNRQRLRIQQHEAQIRTRSRAIERDVYRGRTDTDVEELVKRMIDGGDIKVLKPLLDQTINTAVAGGYYDAEEAAELLAAKEQEIAIGRVRAMEPEDRISALSEPWAKKLPADQLRMLREEAKSANRDVKSLQFAEGYVGLSYEQARARAAKDAKGDAILQEKILDQYDENRAREERSEATRARDILDKYYRPVREGEMDVMDIPEQERNALGTNLENLYSAQKARAGGAPSVSDRQVLQDLFTMRENPALRDQIPAYLQRFGHGLSNTDYKQWQDYTLEQSAEAEGALNAMQQFEAAMNGIKLRDKAERDNLRLEYDRQLVEYEALNGKPGTESRQQILDHILIQRSEGSSDVTVAQPFVQRAMYALRGTTPEQQAEFDEVVAALAQAGKEISPQNVRRVMMSRMMDATAQRLEEPDASY